MENQTRSNLRVSLQSLGIIFMMFVVMAFSCRDFKKGFTSFNPYKDKLSELLKADLSTGMIKFKLVGSRDVVSSYAGATEARGFTYTQEGGGVSVQVKGVLINYPSSSQADNRFAEFLAKGGGTKVKKSGGQKLTSPDGKTVAWTNGSLLCLVTSEFAKPASNFEESAPF